MPYYSVSNIFPEGLQMRFSWKQAFQLSAWTTTVALVVIALTLSVNPVVQGFLKQVQTRSGALPYAMQPLRKTGMSTLQEPTEQQAAIPMSFDDVHRTTASTDGSDLLAPAAALLGVAFAACGLKRATSWSMASISAANAKTDPNCTALNAAADAALPADDGFIPTATERKKILPLALMFFCILFNYTILRDTKDVLMVTAPKSGAEVIPFLKTYVNLPGAILFTIIYSKMSNAMPQSQVFYTLMSVFLSFFTVFSFILYPSRGILHPHVWCDNLASLLPISFAAPISIIRNWTFALFYLMAEMWGSVVVSILFWGLANQICTVKEAKKFYPLFGLGANVALIFSGQYVKVVSKLRENLAPGIDPWGFSLKLLVGGILVSGAVLTCCYYFIQTRVMTDPSCVDAGKQRQSKQKTKLTMKESAKFLMNSTYIRDLALLVICYGMSINIVEVTWKSKLKLQYPDPNSYSAFMGNFSSATGTVTLAMMLIGRSIFEKFGWGVAASITPITLGVTGAIFFSLILAPAVWAPFTAAMGTTPLMLAVLVGAFQNVMSKSAKYSLFDPCKEMAYIPLDAESRTKGKAAVDVIGNPLGKSGGSFIQQALIFSMGSLAVSTPYLGGILGVIIAGWLFAARSLNDQFEKANTDTGEEE